MSVMSTDPKQWNIGLVGYGEVGRILAEDLRKQDVRVTAYDIKLRSDQAGGALRDHAASAWRRPHDFPCRSRLAGRFYHLRRHREPGRAGGAGLRAGGETRRLVPRFQFGFARRQAARGGADRRQRRPLCRGRGDDVDPALSHQGAAVARRRRRRKTRAAIGRARLRCQGGEPEARRRLGRKNVPQRDDKGHGGDGDRELSPPRAPTASRTRCWPR